MSFSNFHPRDFSPIRRLGLAALLATLALGLPSTAHALGDTFFDALDAYDSVRWRKSDGWANGSPFNCGWRADHVNFSGGAMTLTLDNATCTAGCSGKPYASGEYATRDVYGYGKFETRMKAVKGSGTVTGFFIYNGTPWDEIDVEILGKDTTRLQTNYFTNGVGGHETVIMLGFDASLAAHNYAIVWEPGSIKWYVDDVLVHTETGGRGPLPTTPGKIMVNLWPAVGVDSWTGPFSYTSPLTAQFSWIQYFKR
ncbi:MAG TPA: glycoside hydrolase family 16 protein [Thermoanaerobaculia bacterium]|nr:glycoside hydrolase family 16 protein [Thermoanaerobaculia bacterium]